MCRKCGFKMMARKTPSHCPVCGFVDPAVKQENKANG